MLSPQIQPLTVEWEDRSGDYSILPIHQQFEARALETPSSIALTFNGQQLSYNELNFRANHLAHYLIHAGVGGEARVAVCLRPSLEVAVSLVAILKAGGVYVPLDPNDPVERKAIILGDNQPTVILTDSGLLPDLASIGSTQFFCFDRDGESIQSLPSENPGIAIDLEQTAYLVYTSGTTGRPKGVMASHRNLIYYIGSAQKRYGFNAQDIMPALARFTFSISLFELLSPLAAGGQLLILERDDVLNFKRMGRILEQVTVIHASPSWWRKLFAYGPADYLNGQKFQLLRHVSSGGDTVPGDLLETMKRVFPSAEVFVIYGCTEISCMGCTYPALRDRTITKSWLGHPFNQVEVRLLDPDQQAVPAGAQGEIYIGGPGVTKGYLNLPEVTREKFVSIGGQRFYRTGDLGRYEGDNLAISGRVDFQIQLRGIRIEPGEIEAHLRQAPGVLDAVVVARELGNREKSLVAYLVLEQTKEQDIEAIRFFLKARLPDYMLPAAFVVLDAIPVNSNQKVDRRALPTPTFDNLARLKVIVPPRDRWEKELVELWEHTLDVRPIGIQNSFFELGGDSLQAVQILMQIEERWKRTLPISILVEAKSIEALAEVIRADKEEGKSNGEILSSNVVPLRSGGKKVPLFCLQGVVLYQALAERLDSDQPVYAVFLPEEVELIKTRTYDPVNSAFSSIPRIASCYLESIRSIQPHGPYQLAGSSFAGLIAFEMAHQLQAAGEDVALVAMFDSMMIRKVPLLRRLQCHWDLAREQGLAYLGNKTRQRIESLRQKITSDKGNGQIRSGAGASSGASIEVQRDILDEVSIHAARSYTPRPYSGKLVLFRAMDQAFFSENLPDLGWTSLGAGDFTIYDVPGNHMGILKDPSVVQLARQLQTSLLGKERETGSPPYI